MKNLYDYYVLLMNNPGFGLFIVLSCGCLHTRRTCFCRSFFSIMQFALIGIIRVAILCEKGDLFSLFVWH